LHWFGSNWVKMVKKSNVYFC